MGNRTTWRWAITVSALVLTTGCGSQAKPDASSSHPSPTAGTMTTASSSATSSAPAIDPNIPAAARAHTPAGAEAFARYYVEQINAVGLKPQAGLLSKLASPECKSCANYEDTASYMASNRQHYSGPIFTIATTDAGASGEHGVARASIRVQQQPIKVLNRDGTIAQTVPADTAQLDFDVKWTSKGWSISKIFISSRKA